MEGTQPCFSPGGEIRCWATTQPGSNWKDKILSGIAEKAKVFFSGLLLQLLGSGSSPPRAQRGMVQEAMQLPYPVRLQLLALAQATQERFLLPAQGLPGGKEDGAPHIEPHPLGLGINGGWVPGAAQPHSTLHLFPALHPHPHSPWHAGTAAGAACWGMLGSVVCLLSFRSSRVSLRSKDPPCVCPGRHQEEKDALCCSY